MAHCTHGRQTRQIQTLRTPLAQTDGLPFANVLTAQRLQQALD